MRAHTLQPLPVPRGGGTPFAFSWTRLWHAFLRRVAGLGVEVFSARLVAGQELQLHDVAGWTIVCRSGAVWITQEADARDIFLREAEGFALDRGGLTLVRACRDAMLSMRAPAGRASAGLPPLEPPADALAAEQPTQLAWLRSLYPDCGPWNDPASYRRAGLL